MLIWNADGLPQEEQRAFRASFLDNVASVVESLQIIGEELSTLDDEAAANFFEQTAGLVQAFVATWAVGQDRRWATWATRALTRRSPDLSD